MAIDLSIHGGDKLVFKPGLPDDYDGPFLNGSLSATAITGSAQVITQEYAGQDFTIRLAVARIFKKVTLHGLWNVPGLYNSFMLKNGFRKEVASVGKMHLRADQYHSILSGPTSCLARLDGKTEYRAFDVYYGPGMLEQLYEAFPRLRELWLSGQAAALPERKCWMTAPMKEIIGQILDCPYDVHSCSFYIDLKVRELLYLLLEKAFNVHPVIHFTNVEAAKIQKACAILAQHISSKPPTIRELARQVSLNEFKLKAGFRHFHQSGIFEWLLDKKMQHARFLLITTDLPIKQVAANVGYPLTTNFITAFRKKFGVTPGSYRRK